MAHEANNTCYCPANKELQLPGAMLMAKGPRGVLTGLQTPVLLVAAVAGPKALLLSHQHLSKELQATQMCKA